jgi:hypothetical protein
VARRDWCFNTFIDPPSLHLDVLFRDKLRSVSSDVKRSTTTSCGTRGEQRNIVGNYSQSSELGWAVPSPLRARFPPLLRRFPTGNPQRFAPQIRRVSSPFPHVLHTIFIYEGRQRFPESFRSDSEGNSGLGRTENGQKQRSGWECGKRGW